MRWAVLGLAACAPESRFADTRAVCGFVDQVEDVRSMLVAPAYPSEACVDAVLDDFHVDLEPVLSVDGLADPYGAVYGEDSGATLIGRFLWAAQALLTTDLGPVRGARGPWIDPAFTDALGAGPDEPVSGALYDYATHEIRSTAAGDRPEDAAGLQGRRLLLFDFEGGLTGAAVLVHEARHRRGPDHVLCGGEPVCDVDGAGSYGFQRAVHALALQATDEPVLQQVQQGYVDLLSTRIGR